VSVENMINGTRIMTDFLTDFTTVGGH
jgi:hypothetical protein